MSAVMSSCGNRPGHEPVDLDAVRPPLDREGLGHVLHARLRRRGVREPGAAGPRVRRAHVDDRARRALDEVTAGELARAEERAVQRDVDDRAPRVRRHVLGRHREVRRRVVDQHAGQPERGRRGVERGRDLLGIADVARHGLDASAELRRSPACPASRCSGLRLAITTSAPRRANSDAMALPSPVPPPVMNTAVPSNVPGRQRGRADRRRLRQSHHVGHLLAQPSRSWPFGPGRSGPARSSPGVPRSSLLAQLPV